MESEQERMKEILAKVLVILWNTNKDRLIIIGSKQTECSTKRETLKVITSIFDPLGYFTKGKTVAAGPMDSKPSMG